MWEVWGVRGPARASGSSTIEQRATALQWVGRASGGARSAVTFSAARSHARLSAPALQAARGSRLERSAIRSPAFGCACGALVRARALGALGVWGAEGEEKPQSRKMISVLPHWLEAISETQEVSHHRAKP